MIHRSPARPFKPSLTTLTINERNGNRVSPGQSVPPDLMKPLLAARVSRLYLLSQFLITKSGNSIT
jgi:hypothetical protein